MPTSLLLKLAWRNLLRNARRSLFGLVTIAFGVVGMAAAAGFIQDTFEQLGEATISAQLGHLQIVRQGFREGGVGRAQDFLIGEPEKLKSGIRGDSRVEDAMGRLAFSGLLSSGSTELAVEAQGVEPGPEARLGDHVRILEGRNLLPTDAAAVVVGEGVASRLRLEAGTVVSLLAPTVTGALNVVELEVVGVFRSVSKEFDARALRLPLPAAQDLLEADSVNTLVVHLRRTKDTDAVLEALTQRLSGNGLDVQPWQVLSDFYASTKAMYERQFGFLQLIALVLVAMSVINTLNMTVFERTAEFGTMRVLGNRASEVMQLIGIESVVLGAVGATAGCALAIALAGVVSYVGIPMPPPPNMEAGYTAHIVLTPLAIGKAWLIGVASAAVASVPPALRFARISLVDTLRRSF